MKLTSGAQRALRAALAAAAITTVAPVPAGALDVIPAQPSCEGRTPTRLGTAASEDIYGTINDDVIWAGPGNDLIFGLGGTDYICGGGGDDTVFAGSGNDVVYGGEGNDTLYGGSGFDWLNGNDGNDRLVGGSESDSLLGESGSDELDAVTSDNGFADHLLGGDGNDLLESDEGPGNDWGSGGANFDTCDRDAGDDITSCELFPPVFVQP